MLPVRILPVEGRRQRAQFIDLPRALYSGDPAWIEPLRLERSHHLSQSNPFFEHGSAALFLAQRGERVVGRISAQIDRLHLERHGDQEGFFGMLEAEDDDETFAALFGAAESWLAERGMQRVLGPFNFSINQDCGQLVEGFDTPPQIMMPHGRPYTPGRIEARGYTKAQDLLAFRLLTSYEWPERKLRRGGDELSLRPLVKARMQSELITMRELFNDAWSDNWGFVPFTQTELEQLGSLLKHLVPADYVWFAERAGEPVGFIVVVPNLNEAIADLRGRLAPLGWAKLAWRMKVRTPSTARMVLMGLRRDMRRSVTGARIILRMIRKVHEPLLKYGVGELEASWILEGNRPVRSVIESFGGVAYKRYRIYAKELG